MSHRPRPSLGRPAPAVRSALCLAVASVAALMAAAVLVARAVELGRQVVELLGAGGGAGHAMAVTRVEDLVEVVAVLLGLAVAGWLAVGLTTATGCAATRLLGGRWRLGERVVARTAPAVVRRAVALSAGTGIALAGAGLPASADVAPPSVDLGWAPTAGAPAWPGSPTAAPPGPAPDPPVVDDGTLRVDAALPSGSAGRVVTRAGLADARAGAAAVVAPPTPPPGSSPPASPTAASVPAAADAAAPGVAVGGSPQVEEAAVESGAQMSARTDAPAAPSTSPAAAAPAAVVAPSAPVHAAPSTVPAGPSVTAPGAISAGGHAPAEVAVPAGDAPATRAATAPAAGQGGPASATPAVVTVRPGDTLWGIASDFLPADADAQEVARAWPRWYAANSDLIGPDPGLIRPGQQLVSPAVGDGGELPVPVVGAGS